MKEIKITENEAGQRLDRFLLKYFNRSSRANVFKLIRKKVFKVDGKRVDEAYFLQLGDTLQVYLQDSTFDALIEPEKAWKSDYVDLKIVYENDEILIVDKPRGLLTHPDKDEYRETLSTRVQLYLKPLCTRTFKPASVQRLDKNTGGLVLFCKTYDSLKRYNEKMRNREIEKYYLAIVEGRVEAAAEVRMHLVKDEEENRMYPEQADKEGKEAITRYRPIQALRGYTVLEVELLTGRTHQIRAAMQKIGHPIAGDVKYGGRRLPDQTGQLLHCYKLRVDNQDYIQYSEELQAFIEAHALASASIQAEIQV